ncbi:MAG: hypothetical protein HYX53_13380 [Chloroflexi bacterium]|nr:hypothetical protein [Chloroflexota bacterium]
MQRLSALPRWARFAGLAAIGVALAGSGFVHTQGSARAANASVTVGSPANRFAPNISNINVGDTVTFTWASGTHIIDLEGVAPDLTINSGQTTGTTTAFTTPGTYYYYCSIHASESLATEAHVQANDAMVGKIVVTAAATATATTAAATSTPIPPTPTAAAATPTAPAAATATATATRAASSATAGASATTAPGAPSTGTGTGTGGADTSRMFAIIAGAVVLVATGAWYAARRR